MRDGVILMTALVPTIGHQYLVEFASNFIPYYDKLYVIINALHQEPITLYQRLAAFKQQFKNKSNVVILGSYDDMPQNPEDHPDFWNVWKNFIENIIFENTGKRNNLKYLFASENYGHKLSEALGVTFIPVDIDREIFNVKGTDVRKNIRFNFDKIMPEFKKELAFKVTLFGAESCGKTTMAKALTKHFNSYRKAIFAHEWARPYLETVGIEITEEKMETIFKGQLALQKSLIDMKSEFIIQDTDLFSTLGYYKIMNMNYPYHFDDIAIDYASDLYLIMNSDIPFEKDPLRYGGDVRTSNDKFWIELVQRYGLNYHIVKNTDRNLQFDECVTAIIEAQNKKYKKIADYVRP